jgi:hypothetical protein
MTRPHVMPGSDYGKCHEVFPVTRTITRMALWKSTVSQYIPGLSWRVTLARQRRSSAFPVISCQSTMPAKNSVNRNTATSFIGYERPNVHGNRRAPSLRASRSSAVLCLALSDLIELCFCKIENPYTSVKRIPLQIHILSKFFYDKIPIPIGTRGVANNQRSIWAIRFQ